MINLIGFTGAVLCLLLGWQFPWSKTPLIMGLCYGLASLGVSIMMRAGQVSFGHALYAAIGAYTVAFMARAYPGMDGMLMLFFAVIVSAAAGALVGVFVVRYRGIFFGMLNLALSMVVYAMLGKMYDISGGTDGLRLDRPAMLGSWSGWCNAIPNLQPVRPCLVSSRTKPGWNTLACRRASSCGRPMCSPLCWLVCPAVCSRWCKAW